MQCDMLNIIKEKNYNLLFLEKAPPLLNIEKL